MMRVMLKSKLHRVTVTQTELHYEGSCAVDTALLEAADLCEYERVDIYNVNTGQRFSTYVVHARRGSGEVCLMGAAARLANVGDRLIVAAYASFDAAEVAHFQPHIVLVDEKNRIVGTKGRAAVGAVKRAPKSRAARRRGVRPA